MSTIDSLIENATERFGWTFQEPYVNALKAVVHRRRQGLNETQLFFWAAEANDSQRFEAYTDALHIIELAKELP